MATAKGKTWRVEVNRVVRKDSGFTVLYWSVTNISNGEASIISDLLDRRMTANGESGPERWYKSNYVGVESSGIRILDKGAGNLYTTASDTDGRCVCNKLASEAADLSSGESLRSSSAFYLPPDLKTAHVSFPGFDPIKVSLQ